MPYQKPYAKPYDGESVCEYGCGRLARFIFKQGKLCCSKHYNSCPKKRENFSNRDDHRETAKKSLNTRIKKGITKSSRLQAVETMKKNGHYDKLRTTMQEKWLHQPWDNNPKCPLREYKSTGVMYQGTFEYKFLENLELLNGIDWLSQNVARGPALWYHDTNTNKRRLYISDFIIDNTIYEIKSKWTWDKHGEDQNIRKINTAKLIACLSQGYNAILVIDGEEINAKALV